MKNIKKISLISLLIVIVGILSSHIMHKKMPQNQFTIIGFQDTALINKALQFYAFRLGIENINLRVVASDEIPENVEGYVLYEKNPHTILPNAYIKIKANLKVKDVLRVLAHEMIHVKQYLKGELIHQEKHHFIWQGTHITDIRKIAYYQRAWEKEAIKNEMVLLFDFWEQEK